MAECQFLAEAAARVDPDAEVSLAAFEDGFKLGIAFETLRHVAHRRPRGLVTGHVARLILALAGAGELPPIVHEAVGAPGRVGANFGFELEGANSAADPARCSFLGEFRVFLVGGFGVVRAV